MKTKYVVAGVICLFIVSAGVYLGIDDNTPMLQEYLKKNVTTEVDSKTQATSIPLSELNSFNIREGVFPTTEQISDMSGTLQATGQVLGSQLTSNKFDQRQEFTSNPVYSWNVASEIPGENNLLPQNSSIPKYGMQVVAGEIKDGVALWRSTKGTSLYDDSVVIESFIDGKSNLVVSAKEWAGKDLVRAAYPMKVRLCGGYAYWISSDPFKENEVPPFRNHLYKRKVDGSGAIVKVVNDISDYDVNDDCNLLIDRFNPVTNQTSLILLDGDNGPERKLFISEEGYLISDIAYGDGLIAFAFDRKGRTGENFNSVKLEFNGNNIVIINKKQSQITWYKGMSGSFFNTESLRFKDGMLVFSSNDTTGFIDVATQRMYVVNDALQFDIAKTNPQHCDSKKQCFLLSVYQFYANTDNAKGEKGHQFYRQSYAYLNPEKYH